eukprot:GHRR01011679.1.p1 GENE.GHRR01011679.1~~GHRR01011679.1.p1  ORF type:complete len:328 (+),score=62.25 GHRR01011679.1:1038-2021(+)
MRRAHGCQCPWNAPQASSLLIWFTVLAGCYGLFVPIVEGPASQAVVAALYSVAAVIVTGAYLVTCLKDPADHGVYTFEAGLLFCDQCQRYVQRTSKHCKTCDKCVVGFDHHCKWVNNCIGSKNYLSFLVLLMSICSMLAVQLGCGIYLLIKCFTAADDIAARLTATYPAAVDPKGYAAAILLYSLLMALALYPLADLLLLHVVLICRGMTTWDYIMANKEAVPEPRALSRHMSKLFQHFKTLTPRSGRVMNAGDIDGLVAIQTQKRQVGLSPCLACQTDLSTLPTRTAGTNAWCDSVPQQNTSSSSHFTGGFDSAALMFTPRKQTES